jgi:hypothetical protein
MRQTKMTNLFERALRRSRLLFLSALVAVLAACGGGVGTGGTGTGPIQGTVSFGAVAGAPTGSQCVTCTLDLQLQELRVDLAVGCLRFAHTGGWEIGAGGEAVLAGTLESGGASGPATLRLQFSEGVATSAQVTVVLADERGTVVLGPVVLRRTDGVVALPPPDCSAR